MAENSQSWPENLTVQLLSVYEYVHCFQMDRQTDGHMNRQCENSIKPSQIQFAGYNSSGVKTGSICDICYFALAQLCELLSVFIIHPSVQLQFLYYIDFDQT